MLKRNINTIKYFTEKLFATWTTPKEECQFSLEEIAKHQSRQSCWLVAGNIVYDVTPYLQRHPGGGDIILKRAGGTDCQRDLDFHRQQTRKIWKALKIGVVKPTGK